MATVRTEILRENIDEELLMLNFCLRSFLHNLYIRYDRTFPLDISITQGVSVYSRDAGIYGLNFGFEIYEHPDRLDVPVSTQDYYLRRHGAIDMTRPDSTTRLNDIDPITVFERKLILGLANEMLFGRVQTF